MMAKWTVLLPLWFIRWYARKYCEVVVIGGHAFSEARPDVFILIASPKK